MLTLTSPHSPEFATHTVRIAHSALSIVAGDQSIQVLD